MCLGIPGKIIDVYEAGGLPMGKVDFGGATRECCLAYVPEARVGDYTLCVVFTACGKGFGVECNSACIAVSDHRAV